MVTWATVRTMCSDLPGLEEGRSWGTPAFRTGKRLVVRLREDGETLVVSVGRQTRAALLADGSDAIFTESHYDGDDSRYVLVRLGLIDESALRELLVDAWADLAPARLVRVWRLGGDDGSVR